MTPDDLEVRLGDRPASSTVDVVLAALHADPAWSVQDVTLQGEAIAAEPGAEEIDPMAGRWVRKRPYWWQYYLPSSERSFIDVIQHWGDRKGRCRTQCDIQRERAENLPTGYLSA